MTNVKRIAACLISIAYWVFTLGGRLCARRNACVVLYYHGVPESQGKRFRLQMQWLARRYDVVRLGDALMTRSRPTICLTFDDALDSVRRVALPVLEELRLPATIFAVSGNLGIRPKWDLAADHPDAKEPVMSSSQLQSIAGDRIEIGSHTQSHPHLPKLSEAELRRELADSKRELEQILSRPITSFSVPYGEVHPLTAEVARNAGYERVVTCEPRIVYAGDSPLAIGRFKTDPSDSRLEFRLKTAGAYAWRSWLRRRQRTVARPSSSLSMNMARREEIRA